MKPITMDRAREWDDLFGDRVGAFVQTVLLKTFFHEDNMETLYCLSHALGIPIEELLPYIWLRVYARELRGDYEDLPDIKLVAQQLGVTVEELHEYVCSQDSEDCQLQFPEWGEMEDLQDSQEDADYGMTGD